MRTFPVACATARQGGDGFVRQQRHPFPAVFKNGGVIIRLGKKADLGDHSLILGDKKISADEGFPGSEPLHTKLPFSASFPIADRGGKQSVKGIPRKIRRRQAVEGFLKIISEKILIPFPFPAHRIKTAKGGNILGISIFHWHVAAFGDLPNAVRCRHVGRKIQIRAHKRRHFGVHAPRFLFAELSSRKHLPHGGHLLFRFPVRRTL